MEDQYVRKDYSMVQGSMLIKKLLYLITGITQRYNHKTYWRMRESIIRGESAFLRLIKLYRIKRMDAFNNASFGTHLDKSAFFASAPILPCEDIPDNCTVVMNRPRIIRHGETHD